MTARVIRGFASTDIWIAGDGIAHWNGSTWSYSPEGALLDGLNSIWGASSSDLWAFGDRGAIPRRQE